MLFVDAMSAAARWALIVRAYAFPVVLVPAAAAVLAGGNRADVQWRLLPPVMLALLCLHAGTNVINDYYDFRRGVDLPGRAPSTWALAAGLLTPSRVFILGHLLLLASLAAALPVLLIRGWPLWLCGLAGLAGGYAYTAPPGLKYRGLGEITVFVLSGPLLTAGVTLALTGDLTLGAWLCGVPPGLLAAAILYGNNLRDRRRDAAAGFRTLAHRLGTGARWFYPALVVAAGLALIPLLSTGLLRPANAVLAMLGLGACVRPARDVMRGRPLSDIDRRTARAYLLFGLCYCAGLAL